MSARTLIGLLLGALVGFAVFAALYAMRPRETPDEVARLFFLDTYTQEFADAWERVSEVDQEAHSLEDYLAASSPAVESQAAIFSQLAEWGSFEVLAIVSAEPSRSFVSAHIRFPHKDQAEVVELLAAASNPQADRAALLTQLVELNDTGQLKYLEGDISFDLVSEGGRWRVAQHWGQSVTVHLDAAVSPDLPWDFYPIVDEISALPGELVSASYFARNNSNEPITAKAIHEVKPTSKHMQTIECFCFTEQRLEPGEEREMVLLFRIDFSAPDDLTDLENLYTFYTLESFPAQS